jgi:uroporphyrinogen-III synthase
MQHGRTDAKIASVGPVVSDELQACGFRASITPADDAFFMRPLISAMSVALGKSAGRNTAS